MFGQKERAVASRSEDRDRDNVKTITISVILGLLLPLLVLFIFQRKQNTQIADPAVMDVIQVARNISSGQKFTTKIIRPLALTRSNKVESMPDMVNAPLYPAVLSLAVVTGESSRKVQATSALFFLLTIPVLYLLAKRMFNVRVAQLSIIGFMFSSALVGQALSGGPVMMAVFLFTWLCYAMFRYAQESAPVDGVEPNRKAAGIWAAGTGLLLAACYLTEYMLLFAFLPVAMLVWLSGGTRRMSSLALFLLAFSIPAGLWMVRNTMVTGSPLFGLRAMELAAGSKIFPGTMIYRNAADGMTVMSVLREDGVAVNLFRKLVEGITRVYNGLPLLGQPWLAPFFIAGLFYSFRRTGVNAVRAVVLFSFILVLVGSSLFVFQVVLLAPFMPVIIAFGAAYLVRLITDARPSVFVTRVVSTLVVVLLVMSTLFSTYLLRPQSPANFEVFNLVSRLTAKNVPLLTDQAVLMTYATGRTTVMLPALEKDMVYIQNRLSPTNGSKPGDSKLKAMFLSGQLPGAALNGIEPGAWANLYQNLYPPASQGKFGSMDSGSLEGFSVFQGVPVEAAQALVQQARSVLLFRPGGTAVPDQAAR